MKTNIPSENKAGECPVVLAGDLSKADRAVIVLQEWWGLNQQIQDEAKELSDQGHFVTIVPDLYRGKLATTTEDAGHLMGGLDWQGAVQDIRACAQHLNQQGFTKVGVMGFCMGGALSLAAAALVPEVKAAAPFYGIPSSDLCDVAKIKIPLQCHFGEQDEVAGFSDVAAQKVLQEKLRAGGVQFEFFSYKAKHAFTNKTSANFNKEACVLSFARAVQFFKEKM